MKKIISLVLSVILIAALQLVSFANVSDEYLNYAYERYGDKIESAKDAIIEEMGDEYFLYEGDPDADDYIMRLYYLECRQSGELITAMREHGLSSLIVESDNYKYFSPNGKYSITASWRNGEWGITGSSDLSHFKKSFIAADFTPRGLIGYVEEKYPEIDYTSIKYVDATEALGSTWFLYFTSAGEEYIMLFHILDRYDVEFGNIMTADEFAGMIQKEYDDFIARGGEALKPDDNPENGYGGGSVEPEGDQTGVVTYIVIAAAAVAVCAVTAAAIALKKKRAEQK